MKDLFECTKAMTASGIKKVIAFFSGGKDSICMIDVLHKSNIDFDIWYMYYVKNLEHKEKYFSYIESKYNKKINIIPHFDLSKVLKNSDKTGLANIKTIIIKQADIENHIRNTTEILYCCYGMKKPDSMARHAMIGHDGVIDNRQHRIYPLFNWTDKDVFFYLEKNKIKLPEYYRFGFRDINTFKGEALLWIYNNCPNDYEKIKQVFPFVEADILKMKGVL